MATTKHIEYKDREGTHIVKILANKGITWQVQDETTGDIYLVQKKHVIRGPWEETPDEELPPSAPGSLAAQMAAAAAEATAKPRDKKAPVEKPVADPNLVTLKQLCFDLGIEPRIARRRLRKALGNVGTGQRWEWTKDSAEYNKVLLSLSATTVGEPIDPEAKPLAQREQAEPADAE